VTRYLAKVQGPVIADSARKHGIADEDVLHAWRNQIGAAYYDEGFTMVVGPDRAGNLREVGTVDADDGIVIVHADRARPSTLQKVLGG
jgi:transposase-like protein